VPVDGAVVIHAQSYFCRSIPVTPLISSSPANQAPKGATGNVRSGSWGLAGRVPKKLPSASCRHSQLSRQKGSRA
jgi:hypothetical protein